MFVSTHAVGAVEGHTHDPFVHDNAFEAHVFPQLPQLFMSELRLVHVPELAGCCPTPPATNPHSVGAKGEVQDWPQTPDSHVVPVMYRVACKPEAAGQALPHAPQFDVLVFKFISQPFPVLASQLA